MFKFIKDLNSLKQDVSILKGLLGYVNDKLGTIYGFPVHSDKLAEIEKLKTDIKLLHEYLNVEVVERRVKRSGVEKGTIKLEKLTKK